MTRAFAGRVHCPCRVRMPGPGVAATCLAVVLALALTATSVLTAAAAERSARDRGFFEREIVAFEAADRARPPPANAIVFTGSSSIRLWTSLARDMAPLPVVRRGFGGAHVPHLLHNAHRIILPYSPRAVVIFVGGNDLADGTTAVELGQDLETLVELLGDRLPETDLWLLSMKPSPRRWALWPVMQEVDAMLERLAQGRERVRLVMTGRTLLGPDGQPDAVYARDQLHLNEEGYRRWTRMLRPLLLEAYAHSQAR